jgi:hypothetical protein
MPSDQRAENRVKTLISKRRSSLEIALYQRNARDVAAGNFEHTQREIEAIGGFAQVGLRDTSTAFSAPTL